MNDEMLNCRPLVGTPVVIALGSNLGGRLAYLQSAVDQLAELVGLHVDAISPVAQTKPVGGPADQGAYLNVIVLARTMLSPIDLLRAMQRIETGLHRTREVRWGPRTIDLDLIQFGTLIAKNVELELPHPRAKERGFVLVPWSWVDPQAKLYLPAGAASNNIAGNSAITYALVADLAKDSADYTDVQQLADELILPKDDNYAAH